jgi:thiol-disulfide isomerase/thioredoxin
MKTLTIPVLALILVPAVRADEPKVELTSVKLAALKDAVAKHKGQVVVVDFWATFCVPCKAEFPNLVKLHKDLGGRGVACISVTIDDADGKAAALKFLQKQGAAFENFHLDENEKVYQKEFAFASVPTVLVYGKDGALAKKFNADKDENKFTYKDVRKLVEEMIK